MTSLTVLDRAKRGGRMRQQGKVLRFAKACRRLTIGGAALSLALVGSTVVSSNAQADTPPVVTRQLTTTTPTATTVDGSGDVFYALYDHATSTASLWVLPNSTGTFFGTFASAGIPTQLPAFSTWIGQNAGTGSVTAMAFAPDGNLFFGFSDCAYPAVLPQNLSDLSSLPNNPGFTTNTMEFLNGQVCTGGLSLASLAVDDNGTLYFSWGTSNVWAEATQSTTIWGTPESAGHEVRTPDLADGADVNNIAVDTQGDIVASTSTGQIQIYLTSTSVLNEPLETWLALPGFGYSDADNPSNLLSSPNDLVALDASGDVYVEDSGNLFIELIGSQPQNKFGLLVNGQTATALTTVSGLSGATSLAVDP